MRNLKIRGTNTITIARYTGAENYIEIKSLWATGDELDELKEKLEDKEEIYSSEIDDLVDDSDIIDSIMFDFDENDSEQEAEQYIKKLKKKDRIIFESHCEF